MRDEAQARFIAARRRVGESGDATFNESRRGANSFDRVSRSLQWKLGKTGESVRIQLDSVPSHLARDSQPRNGFSECT
jgi:hypothetical protein